MVLHRNCRQLSSTTVVKTVVRRTPRRGRDSARRNAPRQPDNLPGMAAPPRAPTTDIYGAASRLWEAADELRANSHLKAAEYAIPVLGLIFLKFADSRFTQLAAELAGRSTGRRQVGKADYQARGVLFLPEQARFSRLLQLKEGDNLGRAINDAMAVIEEENP